MWEEVTPKEWEESLTQWRWQERYNGDGNLVAYTLLVPCPRCQHENAIDLEFRLKILLDRESNPPALQREIYVQCECIDDHPGRPAEETGCGARSSIKFSIPAGKGQ
jgi:hypothetical protein